MGRAASTLRAGENAPECWKKARRSIQRRWRKAFPGARLGFWGDSASGGSFLALVGDERFVRGSIHQRLQFSGIREAHFDEPGGAMRVRIDFFRRVLQVGVSFDHLAGNRSI